MEYDIKLTAAPPSASILEIGLLSIVPRTYNGLKCWLDSSGFSNTTSLGSKHNSVNTMLFGCNTLFAIIKLLLN
jgi:hypothetical protein